MAPASKLGDLLAIASGVSAEEMRGQGGNVLAPVPQRWNPDLDGVEAELEILAETPGRHFGIEVGVGGRDDSNVGLARPRRAHGFELPRFDHAKQLRLKAGGDVGDLVQKQGTAIREFKAADPVGAGIGESAPNVAEKLTLEDTLRQAADIDGHEGLAASGSIPNGAPGRPCPSPIRFRRAEECWRRKARPSEPCP